MGTPARPATAPAAARPGRQEATHEATREPPHEVLADGLRWRVQVAGAGPVLLLLHGTGASLHSWAGLVPALAASHTVVVPDLPGHAGTRAAAGAALRPTELSLARIARGLNALLAALHLPPPAALAGHSAGAALALRWALDHAPQAPAGALAETAPRPHRAWPQVLGFAPSLVAPPAVYTQWLGPLVTPLATSAPVAGLMARLAGSTGYVDRLLDSTGSQLSEPQRAAYRRLFTDPVHVRGSVGFMAAAELPALMAQCTQAPGLAAHCAFVLGQRDRWVPERSLVPVIQRHLPGAAVQRWAGGHLVHEEQPDRAAAWLLQQCAALPNHDRTHD
jgi:magnesium chelatase accessory protein